MILLGKNPRIQIRDLVRQLGISKQAVHHRMQVLMETGVIKGAFACVSPRYLNAIPMSVSGTSRTTCMDRTLDRLGSSEHTRRVVVASGNYVYVVGFLRNISELDGYVEFVKRTAEMPDPTVGIYTQDDGLMSGYVVDGHGKRRQKYRELTPLDLRIVRALKDNARRPVGEVADAVGVSAKTVRRHLESMLSDGSIDLSVPMDSGLGGDMFLIMHVNLNDGANKTKVGGRLLSKRYFPDQYVRTHSNLPKFLNWVFWTNDMRLLRRALKETSEDKDVHSVMLNFAYLERIYETWLDRLPERSERLDTRATH